MAVTVSRYNHTIKKLLNNEINYADLAIVLLDANAGALFNAAHTNISSLSGHEVSGNGWAAGGEDLASVAVTVVNTNDAMIDADNISKTATGGSIGPAYAAVIKEKASGDLLFFYDFGQVEEAGDTTDFKVNINASGILMTADP